MMPPALFQVERRCEDGACPVSEGACACLDHLVEVDVDELLEAEVHAFAVHGTPAQRAELTEYFAG